MNTNNQETRNLKEEAEAEAAYFDKVYNDADQLHARSSYAVPQHFINQVVQARPLKYDPEEYAYSLLGSLRGKLLLDYGAGDGWNTICFAKAKAKVMAIDISAKGIELVKKKAQANGVEDLVVAEVQDCYRTRFADNTFDVVFGGGILHHLDLEVAGSELARILKPDGVAVFREPIRDTRIMDYVKTLVMYLMRRDSSDTSEHESPLTRYKIDLLRQYFRVVNFRYFDILSSASLLFKSERLKKSLLKADHFLMKIIPGFKRLGRTAIVELKGPIKECG